MRYVIIGYGNIGHKRRVALGKKCVATVDQDPNVQADFHDFKKVPLHIFDTAILSVPQQLKLDLMTYFLERGKNVIVEKPLIITPEQGKKLQSIINKQKVVSYTSYNHRFEPYIEKIQKILQKEVIGRLYHARFVYSFGNIKERLGTWRETEFGVLEEIAPHIIDLICYFWPYYGKDFKLLFVRKIESSIFDHWLFCTKDEKIVVETSSVTWKNSFSIDIYGELGSVHMNGLCKWGRSEFILRKRVFPSGVPLEKRTQISSPDRTWRKDIDYFESLSVDKTKASIKNDINISLALSRLILESKHMLKFKKRKNNE